MVFGEGEAPAESSREIWALALPLWEQTLTRRVPNRRNFLDPELRNPLLSRCRHLLPCPAAPWRLDVSAARDVGPSPTTIPSLEFDHEALSNGARRASSHDSPRSPSAGPITDHQERWPNSPEPHGPSHDHSGLLIPDRNPLPPKVMNRPLILQPHGPGLPRVSLSLLLLTSGRQNEAGAAAIVRLTAPPPALSTFYSATSETSLRRFFESHPALHLRNTANRSSFLLETMIAVTNILLRQAELRCDFGMAEPFYAVKVHHLVARFGNLALKVLDHSLDQ